MAASSVVFAPQSSRKQTGGLTIRVVSSDDDNSPVIPTIAVSSAKASPVVSNSGTPVGGSPVNHKSRESSFVSQDHMSQATVFHMLEFHPKDQVLADSPVIAAAAATPPMMSAAAPVVTSQHELQYAGNMLVQVFPPSPRSSDFDLANDSHGHSGLFGRVSQTPPASVRELDKPRFVRAKSK